MWPTAPCSMLTGRQLFSGALCRHCIAPLLDDLAMTVRDRRAPRERRRRDKRSRDRHALVLESFVGSLGIRIDGPAFDPPRRTGASRRRSLAQRIEQRTQAVVIELLHECEQAPDFSGREALASEPIEVMPGQIGHQSAFVFAEWHRERDEAFEVVRIHRCVRERGGIGRRDIRTWSIDERPMIRLSQCHDIKRGGCMRVS